MDEFLGDAEYFVSNFSTQPGGMGSTFYNWIRRTTNPTSGQMDELHQTLTDLRRRNLTESNVKSIGKQFDNGTRRFDVRTVDDLYVEYKNVDFVGSPLTPNGNGTNQFIEGYLKNAGNTIDNVQWQADYRKLTSWGTPAEALQQMKKQWQNVFTARADDVFNANTELFEAMGINNVGELLEAADDFNHALYSFIRVQ